MIANLSFDGKTNSPYPDQWKHIEKSMENMDTDVRVWRVKREQFFVALNLSNKWHPQESAALGV